MPVLLGSFLIRALETHTFAVRLSHFNQLTRSHATPCTFHAEKSFHLSRFIQLMDEAQAYRGRFSAEVTAVLSYTELNATVMELVM